jgi:hypothetical protein
MFVAMIVGPSTRGGGTSFAVSCYTPRVLGLILLLGGGFH